MQTFRPQSPTGLPRGCAPRNDGLERGRSDGEERGRSDGPGRGRKNRDWVHHTCNGAWREALSQVILAAMKTPCVYILASARNGTLYVGVTSNPAQRIWRHKEGVMEGFTRKYGVKRLVWYEFHATMENAITREKQLKAGNRARKIRLIEVMNPGWRDLYDDILA
jgi:putative endonuclease